MKVPEREELYRRYRMDLYRYLCFLTHDPVQAEDLLSETFVRVIKRLPTFRGECGSGHGAVRSAAAAAGGAGYGDRSAVAIRTHGRCRPLRSPASRISRIILPVNHRR